MTAFNSSNIVISAALSAGALAHVLTKAVHTRFPVDNAFSGAVKCDSFTKLWKTKFVTDPSNAGIVTPPSAYVTT